MFGVRVFQQTVGIPMGTNCAMTTFDNNKSTLKCIVIEIRSLKYFKYSFIIIIIKKFN
jgi:hypothetical protein